jgi:flavin-dependent dehydrogenase
MADDYDVIVIGGGLGGLTAAALLAQAGRKTLLIERNHDVGGAASTYKTGDLVVEASLHQTSDPKDSIDPKHHVLARLGVLDQVEWVPTGRSTRYVVVRSANHSFCPTDSRKRGARFWSASLLHAPASALCLARWNEFLWRSER